MSGVHGDHCPSPFGQWPPKPKKSHFTHVFPKYQGVKEFHMLAHIGCYCNIMVFSLFKT